MSEQPETPNQPESYSPYRSKLAQAIERGEGLEELERQIDHASDSLASRIESLGSLKGWQDLVEILKDESFVPANVRKKIGLAHTVATDIGIFIDKNPKATDEDIRDEVERIIQNSADQKAFKGKTNTILDDQASLSLFIRHIQENPEAAGETFLKLIHKITSVATHEHLKDYAKQSANVVPFPYNVSLALFAASFHARLMMTSLVNYVRGKPVSPEDLKHNVYKNHLSRVLSQLGEGIGDTGYILIAIPGISGLADYVLRHTVGGVIKTTADVLERGDNAKIRESVIQIVSKSVSPQGMDPDQLANNIVSEIDRLAGTGTTKVAKEAAISARYSRVSKAVNFADEITRALWGYAVYGAPSGEQRREKFLKTEAARQSVEQDKRQRDSEDILSNAQRGAGRSGSLFVVPPLLGVFRGQANRSLMRVDIMLPNGTTDPGPTSLEMEQKRAADEASQKDEGPSSGL
jgi:hypothetical protein